MNQSKIVLWCLFVSIWFANVNDLIRGEWFFHDTGSLIFWNILGFFAGINLIFYDKWQGSS